MEKIKVTKEVAEALDGLRTRMSDDRILSLLAGRKSDREIRMIYTQESVVQTHVIRGKMSPMQTAKALINGYEVEKTPEEKVREYYEETEEFKTIATERNYYEFCNGRSVGIRQTLRLLGISIKGVNA